MRPMLLALVAGGALLLGPSSTWADDATPDARRIDQAKRLLLEVSRAYSELPALTDEMTTVFSMEGRPDERSTIRVRLSRSAAEATGIVQTLDVRAVDGHLYLRLDGAEGAVKTELGDDPLASAKKVMGMAYPYLPPQIALRWAKGFDGVGECLMLGMLENIAVADYAMVDAKDGAKRHEVLFRGTTPLLEGSPGTCRVQIDPNTMLITAIMIEGGVEDVGRTMKMTAAFKPQTPARLQEPIVVELGENIEWYDDFRAMLSASWGGVDPGIEVNTAAPTFELVDQNGEKHASAAYRGKIVMLDWWGVWCAACKQALPKLQVLHEKYADNPDVVILAMNVGDDNETMAKYWADNKYTFPTLNDADELARRYGIKAFPSAILIGADGMILHAIVGSASDLEEELEKALDTIK